MLRAIVKDRVWSTKRLPEVPSGALLEVRTEPGGAHLVALDVLGCGPGEEVLVATGSVAAAWLAKPGVPVDALIIASVDERAPSAGT